MKNTELLYSTDDFIIGTQNKVLNELKENLKIAIDEVDYISYLDDDINLIKYVEENYTFDDLILLKMDAMQSGFVIGTEQEIKDTLYELVLNQKIFIEG